MQEQINTNIYALLFLISNLHFPIPLKTESQNPNRKQTVLEDVLVQSLTTSGIKTG